MSSNRAGMITALGMALALSVALNIALSVRAADQRALLDRERRTSRPLVGTRISDFEARTLSGVLTTVSFTESRPTILYSFRPGCSWCERNRASIASLHEQLADRYRFIGVVLSDDEITDHLAVHPLPFDIVTGVDRHTIDAYELGGTPHTLVLAPDGTVTDNWFGAYAGGVDEEIERRLGVSLPEISTSEGPT